MSSKTDWARDADYLRDVQYAGAGNLAARANIHAKYGRGDWFAWLAAQPHWPGTGDILEIGCGPGWFWTHAPPFVERGVRLCLTDLSAGMVSDAVARARSLRWWRDVAGEVADAAALPFADSSFDAVLASHMLYHLPDPRDGLAQIARVLRQGGSAVIATNGLMNLHELLELSRQVFGGPPGDAVSGAFAFENGQAMLEAVFSRVELRRYPDRLVCTDPADVFGYLTSSPPGDGASAGERAALRDAIAAAFAAGDGVLTVTKDVGVFLCGGADLN